MTTFPDICSDGDLLLSADVAQPSLPNALSPSFPERSGPALPALRRTAPTRINSQRNTYHPAPGGRPSSSLCRLSVPIKLAVSYSLVPPGISPAASVRLTPICKVSPKTSGSARNTRNSLVTFIALPDGEDGDGANYGSDEGRKACIGQGWPEEEG